MERSSRTPDLRIIAGVLTIVVVIAMIALGSRNQGDGETADAITTTTSATSTTAVVAVEPDAISPPDPTPPGEVPDPTDLWVVLDRHRYLPEGYVPEDMVVAPIAWAPGQDPERQLLRPEAAEAATDLFAAAEADGVALLGISAYRSYDAQAQIHARSMASHAEEAAAAAQSDRSPSPTDPDASEPGYSAEAGHSEHQTGLALDVSGASGACVLEPCFAELPEATWLADNAHRFGFIIRYPAGAEHLTGYAYEPWHLRYLGPELATEIEALGITFDEWAGTVEG